MSTNLHSPESSLGKYNVLYLYILYMGTEMDPVALYIYIIIMYITSALLRII